MRSEELEAVLARRASRGRRALRWVVAHALFRELLLASPDEVAAAES